MGPGTELHHGSIFPAPDNPDSGLALHGTLVLADPAADAEFFDHPGLFNFHGTIRSLNEGPVEDNRLLRGGAVLLTNYALFGLDKGDAGVFVDNRQTDRDLPLSDRVKVLDGTRGTNLAAQGAGVFTVTCSGHQNGAPQTSQACFQ